MRQSSPPEVNLTQAASKWLWRVFIIHLASHIEAPADWTAGSRNSREQRPVYDGRCRLRSPSKAMYRSLLSGPKVSSAFFSVSCTIDWISKYVKCTRLICTAGVIQRLQIVNPRRYKIWYGVLDVNFIDNRKEIHVSHWISAYTTSGVGWNLASVSSDIWLTQLKSCSTYKGLPHLIMNTDQCKHPLVELGKKREKDPKCRTLPPSFAGVHWVP